MTIDERIKKIKTNISDIINQNKNMSKAIQSIISEGGKPILIGGAVRDYLLNIELKDFDIEIYNLTQTQLYEILKSIGHVRIVGKSFGVFKVDGIDADFSLPRLDSSGRKPEVKIDPFLNQKDAFSRRDLTINAISIDLINFQLIDYFNGVNDLKNKTLTQIDENFFYQDPLRFFRVMQFVSRFEMRPSESLNDICKNMDLKNLSDERIFCEFEKMILKSKRPSLGLRWIAKIGRLEDLFPEFYDCLKTEQDQNWHPEGDVFEHLMQSLDKASQISIENNFNNNNRLVLCFSALCHDLGKSKTTKVEKDGRLHSYGHEIEGIDIAKKVLLKISDKHILFSTILKLIRHHMDPIVFVKNNANNFAYKKLALKLSPETDIQMLFHLCVADKCARNKSSIEPLKNYSDELDIFFQKAKDLKVLSKKEEPILNGKDFISDFQEGKIIGKLVEHSYLIQIKDEIINKDELYKLTIQSMKKLI